MDGRGGGGGRGERQTHAHFHFQVTELSLPDWRRDTISEILNPPSFSTPLPLSDAPVAQVDERNVLRDFPRQAIRLFLGTVRGTGRIIQLS